MINQPDQRHQHVRQAFQAADVDPRIVHRRHEQPFVIDVVERNLLGQFLAERDEIHQLDAAIAEGAELPQQHGLGFLPGRQDQAFDVIQFDELFQRVERSEDGIVVEELADAFAVVAAMDQPEDAKLAWAFWPINSMALRASLVVPMIRQRCAMNPWRLAAMYSMPHGNDGDKYKRREPKKNAAPDFDREGGVEESP